MPRILRAAHGSAVLLSDCSISPLLRYSAARFQRTAPRTAQASKELTLDASSAHHLSADG